MVGDGRNLPRGYRNRTRATPVRPQGKRTVRADGVAAASGSSTPSPALPAGTATTTRSVPPAGIVASIDPKSTLIGKRDQRRDRERAGAAIREQRAGPGRVAHHQLHADRDRELQQRRRAGVDHGRRRAGDACLGRGGQGEDRRRHRRAATSCPARPSPSASGDGPAGGEIRDRPNWGCVARSKTPNRSKKNGVGTFGAGSHPGRGRERRGGRGRRRGGVVVVARQSWSVVDGGRVVVVTGRVAVGTVTVGGHGREGHGRDSQGGTVTVGTATVGIAGVVGVVTAGGGVTVGAGRDGGDRAAVDRRSGRGRRRRTALN